VPRVHKNGNAGQLAGNDAIVVDEMIVRMKDVRAIDAQLPGDLENCPRTGASGFLESVDFDSGTLSLRRQATGMGQAVDYRFMAIRTLTLREVEDHPLKAAHIEMVDELNYSHGV